MNDTTLTQLKIIVERAVRPVRASTSCRRKMREELLAHVSAVFDEEEAKLGEGQATLARTQERLGHTAELTDQLQASVPRSDWFGRFVEYFEVRPDESTLRRATTHALITFSLFGAAILPAFIVQHRLREWPTIPAAAILAFCFTLMSNWMRDALYGPAGRSWLRAIVVGGACSLLVPGMTFGVCLTFTGEAWSSLMSVLPLIPWAGLLVWVPVSVAAYMTDRGLRYRREWDSLQIS
jgi:hypothetical protein